MNLTDLVQKVRAERPDLIAPADVADAVLAAIPARQRADALAQALPSFCSGVITTHRARPTVPASSVAPTRSPQPSRWGTARTDAYPWLDESHAGADGWKALADFTREDAEHAAESRRRRAESILANADWFERCAKALADAGVAKVSKLPTSVLDELGGPPE